MSLKLSDQINRKITTQRLEITCFCGMVQGYQTSLVFCPKAWESLLLKLQYQAIYSVRESIWPTWLKKVSTIADPSVQTLHLFCLSKYFFFNFRELSEIQMFFCNHPTTPKNWWSKTRNTQQSAMDQRPLQNHHTQSWKEWQFPRVSQSLQVQGHTWATTSSSFTTWIRQESNTSSEWIWKGHDPLIYLFFYIFCCEGF